MSEEESLFLPKIQNTDFFDKDFKLVKRERGFITLLGANRRFNLIEDWLLFSKYFKTPFPDNLHADLKKNIENIKEIENQFTLNSFGIDNFVNIALLNKELSNNSSNLLKDFSIYLLKSKVEEFTYNFMKKNDLALSSMHMKLDLDQILNIIILFQKEEKLNHLKNFDKKKVYDFEKLFPKAVKNYLQKLLSDDNYLQEYIWKKYLRMGLKLNEIEKFYSMEFDIYNEKLISLIEKHCSESSICIEELKKWVNNKNKEELIRGADNFTISLLNEFGKAMPAMYVVETVSNLIRQQIFEEEKGINLPYYSPIKGLELPEKIPSLIKKALNDDKKLE